MKKLRILLPAAVIAASFSAIMTSCSSKEGFGKDRQVTLSIPSEDEGDVKTMRLTVISDNIIHVEASPEDQIPQKRKSLMIVGEKGNATSTITQNDSVVTINTTKLTVEVCKKTGLLQFTDKTTGEVILQEADGSKKFTKYVSNQTELPAGYHPTAPDEINYGKKADLNKISLEDRSGYSYHMLFNSDDDEAFYGLGQHQAEEMNYKSRNEELFQYNTKEIVPFIVSTKNYGILWDTYSLCRWGNPEPYQQLGTAFTLYDKDGNEGHLTGTYVEKKTGKKIVRDEDSLYFENLVTIKNLPQDFDLGNSDVKFEGSIVAPVSAKYRFILYYAGYTKVFVGGKEVIPERWRTAWNPNSHKFEVDLVEGEKTPILIEWQPDGGESYCGLRAATPKTEEEQGMLSFWSEMSKDMDYYFIAGETIDDVIGGYRFLTGKAQVMPRWSLGFWQSRERYKTQEELLSNLTEMRQRGIPVDVIVQDWSYWEEDQWGKHAFDPARYPDPQQMIDSIHALNGRLLISVWPKFYMNTDHYKELDENGWMYQQAIVDSIRDWIGPGYIGSFYDAYSKGARDLFWKGMDEELYSKYNYGIDAWWMDASEPNVRDCTPIEYRKALCGPTALGTSDEYFNGYAIVNADAIYNGQRSVNPNTRVFLLTRSAMAGLQRYSAATWSGDIGTRWEDMRAQMTAGINFCMSGIPFWGMDNGGFCVEKRYEAAAAANYATGAENEDLNEWRELQTRWNQFGCFVPLYRTHGQWPPREAWNIAPEDHQAYQSILYYGKLRYRLLPYIYSLAGWVNLFDYTIMRGLAMDFTSDKDVYNIPDQWMFGPALMACPVGYYKARSRGVYLPNTTGWYDFYTGQHYDGGQTITADAPYEKIPVFVREGSIIPFGPELQWTDEKKPELINLYVYQGSNGKFVLYEDEGVNYNYEKGAYSTIEFSYDDSSKTLTIGERKGTFDGMLQNRQFNVVFVGKSTPKALNLDDPEGTLVDYDGTAIDIKL